LHLQEAIDAAKPGDTIRLLPGVYDEPVVIENKKAADQPIVIRGHGCATLDGRRNVLRPADIGDIGFDHYAFFRIRNASGIVIENATIQNVWPTAIYAEDVQHLTVRKMNLNGATFGVFARGRSTEHITLEHCSWIQDTRIWDEVSWRDIHDRPNPRRELDGDFVRSLDIKGNLVARYNFIAQAFNGIHLFASKAAAKRGGVNENVWIYRNTFAFIRDSAVEAERTATNWWIFENKIYNCHTWFAFEKCCGGYWYIFANRGWFDRKPGPPGDCHTGGAVIKTNQVDDGEIETALPQHPHYVFNNSWYLRAPLLKKGRLRHFHHFNNAIAYARPEHHPEGVVDLGRRMIGVGASDPRCEGSAPPEEPFTKEWDRFDIHFDNDVSDHPDFPEGLNRVGYPMRGVYADLGFAAGRNGEFELAEWSACRGRGRAARLELSNGETWAIPEELDVGAMRGALPYTPDDLACPRDVLPDDYEHDSAA
jgi:hypothetical protein